MGILPLLLAVLPVTIDAPQPGFYKIKGNDWVYLSKEGRNLLLHTFLDWHIISGGEPSEVPNGDIVCKWAGVEGQPWENADRTNADHSVYTQGEARFTSGTAWNLKVTDKNGGMMLNGLMQLVDDGTVNFEGHWACPEIEIWVAGTGSKLTGSSKWFKVDMGVRGTCKDSRATLDFYDTSEGNFKHRLILAWAPTKACVYKWGKESGAFCDRLVAYDIARKFPPVKYELNRQPD